MFQNRVDPFGNFIITKARGTFMGNRGVIHDHTQKIVRRFKHKAWIICVLQFKGRHRHIMQPDKWTELFFLDEATAFSAGHRPCAECRRADFNHFKSCWLAGNPEYGFDIKTSITQIDAIIQGERINADGTKKIHEESSANIPNGTFVLWDENAFLVADNLMYKWSPSGYDKGTELQEQKQLPVLTPRSVVNAFREGYRPKMNYLNSK